MKRVLASHAQRQLCQTFRWDQIKFLGYVEKAYATPSETDTLDTGTNMQFGRGSCEFCRIVPRFLGLTGSTVYWTSAFSFTPSYKVHFIKQSIHEVKHCGEGLNSMVFSFFCGPKQVLAQTSDDYDDKRVSCLEEQSATTFDTLETDDSDVTLEKDSNGPRPIRGSGSLMESGDVAHVGNNCNIKELPQLAEGIDLQSGENGEDPKDPDSATEAVKGNAEGSDMPKYADAAKSRGPNVDRTNETPPEMTDESNGVGSSITNTVDGNLDEASISEETDAACVKEKDYEEKNLETGSTEAEQNEEEVEVSAHVSDCVEPTPESGLADSEEPPNEGGTLKEADCPEPNIEAASLDDSRDEAETGGTEKDDYPEPIANETHVEVGTDIVRAIKPDIEAGSTDAGETEGAVVQRTDHRERNPQQEEGESTPETDVDCSEANAKTGSDKPPNEEANPHPKAKDAYAEPSPETCSVDMTASDAMEEDESDLVLPPGLDTDDAQVNDVSLNDSLYSDGIASDTMEEGDARDLSTASERSVRFADPLVTSSLEVPRINADDLDELFYTATEISE